MRSMTRRVRARRMMRTRFWRTRWLAGHSCVSKSASRKCESPMKESVANGAISVQTRHPPLRRTPPSSTCDTWISGGQNRDSQQDKHAAHAGRVARETKMRRVAGPTRARVQGLGSRV
eukprot:2766117-Rhodomonas_salina.5